MSIEKELFVTKEIKEDVIMLSMEITFSEWLQTEIEKRGLSWNKFAENAGLSSGTIYNIRDGTRGVGENSLKAIAMALKIPPEQVFRAAGLLPESNIKSDKEEELLYLFAQLPDVEKSRMIEFVKFTLAAVEKEQGKKK
jgi:transcriptional regulator with XRE-family HTH domain